MKNGIIDVSSNVEEVEQSLAETNKSVKALAKSALQVMARGAVKAIKATINETTEKDTGELLKAYHYSVWKSGEGAMVYPKAIHTKNIFAKVGALNNGVEGQKRTPKCFVQSGEAYLSSATADSQVSQDLNKKIEDIRSKYWT